nr:GGDEF domain-containing protein [Vibrio fluvialis]
MFGSITAGVSLYLYRIRKDKLELSKITFTDELSGLHNRHYLKKVSRQLTPDGRYYLCILDIDHFKSVNDKYGHDIGDQVIKRVASVIKSRIRLTDYAFRFGGEEFVVVIKTDSTEQAVRIFDRIREDVARFVQAPKVTISGGVWPVIESVDDAIKQADRLLYMAKEGGRNTILSEAA